MENKIEFITMKYHRPVEIYESFPSAQILGMYGISNGVFFASFERRSLI